MLRVLAGVAAASAAVSAAALAVPAATVARAAPAALAAADPVVAVWTAKETCRGGGCSPVTGVVKVAGSAAGFTGTVTATLYQLGDPKCTHAPGQAVWTFKAAGTGRYEGTSDVFTSDSSPGFNCQHGPFAATWSLTGRNLLTLSSTAYGGITHTFTRTPPVDETPPVVALKPAAARAGKVARLPFTLKDDSGRATIHVIVDANGKTYGPVGAVRAARGAEQTIGLALPAGTKGVWRYCAWAEDPAGNASQRVCAALTIR